MNLCWEKYLKGRTNNVQLHMVRYQKKKTSSKQRKTKLNSETRLIIIQ